MRRVSRIVVLSALLILVGGVRAAVAAPPSKDEIRDALEAGVESLINMQQEDGSWKVPDVAHGGDGYDVGRTALATLALLHAERHVKSTKVQPAIHKGLTFIVQQWPEPKTYTAGLVQQALYKADPRRYQKHISMYGWMLVRGQMAYGPQAGCFTYGIYPFPKDFDSKKNYEPDKSAVSGRGDNSNTQFGVLALLYSDKSGVQIPKICWLRLQKYYMAAQHQDGGWDYQSDTFRDAQGAAAAAAAPSTHNMTFAGTISLSIANEMLYANAHDQCRPQPMSEPVERGLEWIAKNWSNGLAPYGWYACERLGILMGYSEFGGTDWYETGSEALIGQVRGGSMDGFGGAAPNLSFGILFLSRGLEPIIFNKLKRSGDWNNHLHDLAHATEYISKNHQLAKQWRIVTLNASVDYLLRVPTLWISGHDKLIFTDDEKQKLKQYVERGGTILGEACCSKSEFNNSFRALMAELWPDSKLMPLPATHPLFDNPRPLKEFKPQILGLAIQANQGRLGVLYLPNGISCQWERGGTRAGPALDVATNIYYYVDKFANRGKTPEQIEQEKVPTREGPATVPATPATTPADPATPATPATTPADPTVKPEPKHEVDEEAK